VGRVGGGAVAAGVFLGASVGGAPRPAPQSAVGVSATSPIGLARGSCPATDDSFTAGAQIGYNLQKGCTLFGIEADWNWADLNADTRILPILAPAGLNNTLGTRIENFGTIRTRTGVVVDQLLLYVTGGLAWAD